MEIQQIAAKPYIYWLWVLSRFPFIDLLFTKEGCFNFSAFDDIQRLDK